MDSVIHHLNPIGVATVRADRDAIWIGLDSDTALIPDAAIVFRNLPDPGWSVDDFSESGQILPIDTVRNPDWYRSDEQWAPWTPTAFLLNERPWYDQLETAVPVEERLEGWSMAEEQRLVCSGDLIRTQACVRSIVEFDQCFPPQAKAPLQYPAERLAKVYSTRKLVQINAAKAKRSILQALAFMSWWTAIRADWESQLNDTAVEIISKLLATTKGKRGVICDLERDWPVINIPLYLQHKIPFFYLWDFDVRADQRFSRLNPALNLTYWAVRQGTTLDLHRDLEEDDLNKIAREAVKLDHYFQQVFTYRAAVDPSILSSYPAFIIDFVGWKRRPINRSEESTESLAKLYYYGVFDDNEEYEHKVVVFWRWRKREPRDEYLRCQYKTSLPGEEPAGILRELYKFGYAPKPGVQYDDDTGLRVVRNRSPGSSLSLLERMGGALSGGRPSLQDRLSDDTPRSDTPNTQSAMSDDDLMTARILEVPDTLYHPRAINSPAAWIRHNENLLTNARQGTADRRASQGIGSTPFRRSQSPTRISDPIHSSHERPEIMFQRLLRDESAKITYTTSTWFAPHFAWNPEFLEAAYLFIPDEESEARLRYWANCWDSVGTVKRLLTIAIEHGIRFHLSLPPDSVRRFRPIIVDNLDRSSASFIYNVGFQEPPLLPADNAATYCATYLARMNDVLRRPHACAFIAEGGQLSWIARRWSGTRLVEEFMSGPSIQITVHNRGFYDSASEDASYLSHDIVSEQEKDLLLGYCSGSNGCSGRWLFPPADMFNGNFDLWTGEWNAALDHIYRRLADDIARGKAKLRTREKWKCWIRNNERGQRRPSYLPSATDFRDVMEGISKAGLKPTWHKEPLDNITFPERRVD
ncbi:uncharacterized protein LACBIDRAFT_319060 [Laccaria bicolor S238N-H82]|uniref:Predicted protein n=1 Tax=Laccaria bicolor (strain S238N-H82 / ATCC MYA-4686) TaxID=486041 RepID=B0D7S0_LACBS|nr:uncharacterized protein LACBIDRAFT_319060 [Laccaria bicolor S238N-H82]EDR09697.1 predicted protein [Laccaria bicolor S238N-H82]|eukprot:XP_001880046.1 predicted protein [Laccaria bicolor S238N-H82]